MLVISPCFPLGDLWFRVLKFRFLIHFKISFVNEFRECSNFIILHLTFQFSQCLAVFMYSLLTKRLSSHLYPKFLVDTCFTVPTLLSPLRFSCYFAFSPFAVFYAFFSSVSRWADPPPWTTFIRLFFFLWSSWRLDREWNWQEIREKEEKVWIFLSPLLPATSLKFWQ